MVTRCNQLFECNQIHLFSALWFALSAKSSSPPPHLVPIPPSLTPITLSWLTLWFWRRKQTEQVPSWKPDSILGWTVEFDLCALYLWKQCTNWKTKPPGWRSLRTCTQTRLRLKNMLIISVTEQSHKSHYAYQDMTTGLLINVHCLIV